jgi:AraC-like DNA-binding protein
MHDINQLMHKISLVPSRVVTAGKVEKSQGAEVKPHHHMTWELVYILQGDIRCPMGDDVYEAQPGVLLLTPPRTVHYEICSTAWACYYILIDMPAEHPWPRVYRDDSNRTFGNLCNALIRELGAREPDRDEMLSLLSGQIEVLLRRTHVQRHLSPAERLIRDVERCLEERFTQRIVIKALASELGVSPSYLSAQFMRLRGRTPMAYLQELRVQHAVTLTRNSNVGLEAIATLCGYDSASHLSRHVKRATGKSPGAFRSGDLNHRL